MKTTAALAIGLSLILLSGCVKKDGNSTSVPAPVSPISPIKQEPTSPAPKPAPASPTTSGSQSDGSSHA